MQQHMRAVVDRGLDGIEHRGIGVAAQFQAGGVRERHVDTIAGKARDRRILANRRTACREATEMATACGMGRAAAGLVGPDDNGREPLAEQANGRGNSA